MAPMSRASRLASTSPPGDGPLVDHLLAEHMEDAIRRLT